MRLREAGFESGTFLIFYHVVWRHAKYLSLYGNEFFKELTLHIHLFINSVSFPILIVQTDFSIVS